MYDLSEYITKYQDKKVIDRPTKGVSRPSHDAFVLWCRYKKLQVNEKLDLMQFDTEEYHSSSYLDTSDDFVMQIMKVGSAPYYIHKDLIEILKTKNLKEIVKIAQMIRMYLGPNHPFLRGIFVFDKWANSRENKDEDYVRIDLMNPGYQKSTNGFFTLRLQGSRIGSNEYSKQFSEQNRKVKENYLRFIQHGDDRKPLICCKTGKLCERIPERCPKTGEHPSPVGYDLHHPKYTYGGSDNKNGKEPSNIMTKAGWSTEEKMEIIGCLALRTGVHIQHHRIYQGSQDLDWWMHHWKTDEGYMPFAWKSEENYKKVLKYFDICYEDVLSFDEFIRTLYF